MSRITDQEQYRRYQFLQMLWCESKLQVFWALLSLPAQWQIHEYYRPAEELSPTELNDHLQKLKTQRPELSRVAGRHFKYLEAVFTAASRAYGVNQEQMQTAIMVASARRYRTAKRPLDKTTDQQKTGRSSSANVLIAPIVKPIDVKKLAMACLRLTEEIARNNVAGKDSNDKA